MDFSQDQFVNSLAEEFMCPICTDIVQNPLQCLFCDIPICKHCTPKLQSCPNCSKTPFQQKNLSRLLRNVLDKLDRRRNQSEYLKGKAGCPMKGCFQLVEESNLEKHLKQDCNNAINLKKLVNFQQINELETQINELKKQNDMQQQQINIQQKEIQNQKLQIQHTERIEKKNQELIQNNQVYEQKIKELEQMIVQVNSEKQIRQDQINQLQYQKQELLAIIKENEKVRNESSRKQLEDQTKQEKLKGQALSDINSQFNENRCQSQNCQFKQQENDHPIVLSCQHYFCKNCLILSMKQKTSNQKINQESGEQLQKKCPSFQCQHTLTNEEIERILDQDFDQGSIQKAEEKKIERQNQQNINQTAQNKCMNYKCSFRQKESKLIKLNCNHIFCRDCLLEKIKKTTNQQMNIFEFENDHIRVSCIMCYCILNQENFKNILGEDYQYYQDQALLKTQNQAQDKQLQSKQERKIQTQFLKWDQSDQQKGQSEQIEKQLKCCQPNCQSQYPRVQMVSFRCQHTFCNLCFKKLFPSEVQNEKLNDLNPMKQEGSCPQCTSKLNQNQIKATQQLKQQSKQNVQINPQQEEIKKQYQNPIQQIQNPYFNCIQCQKSHLNNERIDLQQCKHFFCQGCLRSQIEKQTNGNYVVLEQEFYKVECQQCCSKLSLTDFLNILGQESYDKYYQEAIQRVFGGVQQKKNIATSFKSLTGKQECSIF